MSIESVITENLDIWTSAIKTKSASGRGSSNKLELYGIKKLRELILELAVRGKLVPQDPNDEPAFELLQKIEAEKLQLIATKKIKKSKNLSSLKETEIPFQIPSSWKWVRLGDIGYTQTGGTPKKSNPEHYGNDIPFIKPADIDEMGVNYNNVGLSKLGAEALGRVATNNSVLMVCIGTIGKCQIIDRDCSFNQQINAVTPYMSELGKYLFQPLRSSFFCKLAWEMSSATTIAILNKGKWELLPVPLPPLAEQKKIVAKIDELMLLCDQLESQTESSIEAHKTLVETLLATLTNAKDADELNERWQRISEHFDTLFTTEDSIDQLKQTILQLAVMGKLVKQDPNDEPASALLARIAEEKEQLIKDKKIKKQKALSPISEDDKPFELPNSWSWVNLSELFALVTDGDHQAPPKADIGFPFLVIGNLNQGKVNFDNCRFVPESYFEKLDWGRKPTTGDLLYTVTGSYGIPILVESNDKFCVQRHVAILKAANSTPVKYVKYLMQSRYAYDFATEVATGIAQKTVPLTGLRRMPVSLPPFEEQHRIVKKIEELLLICESIKLKVIQAKDTQQTLADSISSSLVN